MAKIFVKAESTTYAHDELFQQARRLLRMVEEEKEARKEARARDRGGGECLDAGELSLRGSDFTHWEEEREDAGRCLAPIVLCAFAVEACLNHVGARRVPCWDRMERKLGIEDKLEVVLARGKTSVDKGNRPFQTLKDMIRFRNAMAHGRTEQLQRSGEHDGPLPEDLSHLVPKPWWVRFSTIENARRCVDDTNFVIEYLEKLGGAKKRRVMQMVIGGRPRRR